MFQVEARIELEAVSVASFARQLAELDHETRAVVTATESGVPWATVEISPLTDARRSAFPTYLSGIRGDTRKRGQSGAHFTKWAAADVLSTVIERARRMHRADVA